MGGGNRGLSPVVGVVLLVAIVVALGAVSMTFFFTSSSDQDDNPAPNTQMNMEQVTSLELYNNPDVVEYELKMIGGESLDGSKVEIQGIRNPDMLNGQQFAAGQSITVTPVEDQIRIVYRSEDRVDAVLHTFDVSAGGSVDMKDCDWLADQQKSHFTTEPESTANTMVTKDDVTIPQDAVVNCNIETEGRIEVNPGAELIGWAKSIDNDNKNVELMDGSVIHGDVVASNEISADNAVLLSDAVGTDGSSDEPNMYIEDSRVEGDLRVDSKKGGKGSKIFLNGTTAIGGDVSASKGATGDLTLQEGNVTIGGDIDFSEAGSASLDLRPPGAGINREYVISGDMRLDSGGSFAGSISHMKLEGNLVVYNVGGSNSATMSDTTIEGDLYTSLDKSPWGLDFQSNVMINGTDSGSYTIKSVSDYEQFDELYANVTSATVTSANPGELRVTFDKEITKVYSSKYANAFDFTNLGPGVAGWRAEGDTVVIELDSDVDENNANIRVAAASGINSNGVISAGGTPFDEQFDIPVENNAGG